MSIDPPLPNPHSLEPPQTPLWQLTLYVAAPMVLIPFVVPSMLQVGPPIEFLIAWIHGLTYLPFLLLLTLGAWSPESGRTRIVIYGGLLIAFAALYLGNSGLTHFSLFEFLGRALGFVAEQTPYLVPLFLMRIRFGWRFVPPNDERPLSILHLLIGTALAAFWAAHSNVPRLNAPMYICYSALSLGLHAAILVLTVWLSFRLSFVRAAAAAFGLALLRALVERWLRGSVFHNNYYGPFWEWVWWEWAHEVSPLVTLAAVFAWLKSRGIRLCVTKNAAQVSSDR